MQRREVEARVRIGQRRELVDMNKRQRGTELLCQIDRELDRVGGRRGSLEIRRHEDAAKQGGCHILLAATMRPDWRGALARSCPPWNTVPELPTGPAPSAHEVLSIP